MQCHVFSAVQAPLGSVVWDLRMRAIGLAFVQRVAVDKLLVVAVARVWVSCFLVGACTNTSAPRLRPVGAILALAFCCCSWSDLAPALQAAGGLWPLQWCWFLPVFVVGEARRAGWVMAGSLLPLLPFAVPPFLCRIDGAVEPVSPALLVASPCGLYLPLVPPMLLMRRLWSSLLPLPPLDADVEQLRWGSPWSLLFLFLSRRRAPHFL